MAGPFDDLIRFLNSPTGRVISNIARDAFNNHIIPYMKENMGNALKPAHMSEEEQVQRAKDEFVTVDDFDIQHEDTKI